MTQSGVLSPKSPLDWAVLPSSWTARALVALSCLIGCGPAIKTESLRLDGSASLPEPPSETFVMPEHPPTPTPLPASRPTSLRFEPLSTVPPFVYRVIEAAPSDHPLFALTLQSCGKFTQQAPLGNARVLFSGMGKVELTPIDDIAIGTEHFPLQAADARFEGERVYLRVLSVASAECLTDVVVWSSENVQLTDRAAPAIEQLFIMHRHHIIPPSLGDKTPPS